jgi:hypothetical protein
MASSATTLEALRKAIILDCEESLSNPKNGFTEASQEDVCKCYNNLKVVIRVLKTDRSKVEMWHSAVEQHIINKPCKHKWSRERMDAAAWDVVDAK